MDYIARYGLEFNPFLKNSRDILIETQETKEVRFRLEYLSKTKEFGLLVGAPGLGKTTALRSFAASLNPANFKVIYIGLSTLTIQDFYRHLVSCPGAQPCYHKTDNFRLIQSAINRLAVEKRITPFFIIDEANYLNTAVLNAANGVPRIINRLCDSCLLISHTDGLAAFTAEAAMKAVNDVQLE